MYRKPTIQQRIADTLQDAAQAWGRFVAQLRTVRKEGMTPRMRRQAIVLAVALVVAVVACAVVVVPVVNLISNPERFQQMLQANYPLAVIAYALINTLHVFVAIIPGEPLELVAGLLFGTWGGLAVVSAGLALGELLVFLLVRRFGPRFVHLFVSQEKLDELVLFRDQRRRNVITFLMMFIPGTPKDIWSYVVGLTPMRLSTWMLISIPARVPSILISTAVGATAASGRPLLAALLFVLVILVSVFGIYYYLLISRQARVAAAMEEVARREWETNGRRSNDAESEKRQAAEKRETAQPAQG